MQWILIQKCWGLSRPAKVWSPAEEESMFRNFSRVNCQGLWTLEVECHHHETHTACCSSVVICPGSCPGSHSAGASISDPEHPSSHLHLNSPLLWDLIGSVPRCYFGQKQGRREEIRWRWRIYYKETRSSKKRLDQTERQMWFHKLIYLKFVFLSLLPSGVDLCKGD